MHISSPTHKRVRIAGAVTLILGMLFLVAGIGTTVAIREQLRAEKITIDADSPIFAGNIVDDPLDAFLQAEVIKGHAAEIGGNLTYAELPRDDPRRETLEKTSFLRASLFTSVIAFGVAALVAGIGVALVVIGWAVRSLAGVDRRATRGAGPEPIPAVA